MRRASSATGARTTGRHPSRFSRPTARDRADAAGGPAGGFRLRGGPAPRHPRGRLICPQPSFWAPARYERTFGSVGTPVARRAGIGRLSSGLFSPRGPENGSSMAVHLCWREIPCERLLGENCSSLLVPSRSSQLHVAGERMHRPQRRRQHRRLLRRHRKLLRPVEP